MIVGILTLLGLILMIVNMLFGIGRRHDGHERVEHHVTPMAHPSGTVAPPCRPMEEEGSPSAVDSKRPSPGPIGKAGLRATQTNGGDTMLSWALVFLVVGIIAGVLGLSGIAGAATQIAWILFVVGLILAIVFFLMGRRPPI